MPLRGIVFCRITMGVSNANGNFPNSMCLILGRSKEGSGGDKDSSDESMVGRKKRRVSRDSRDSDESEKDMHIDETEDGDKVGHEEIFGDDLSISSDEEATTVKHKKSSRRALLDDDDEDRVERQVNSVCYHITKALS